MRAGDPVVYQVSAYNCACSIPTTPSQYALCRTVILSYIEINMSSPTIRIAPEFAVFDQVIDIQVINLPPNAPVTIDCSIFHHKVLYIGFGHFYADDRGIVNAGKFASHGK